MKITTALFVTAVMAIAAPKDEYIKFMDNFMKKDKLSYTFSVSQLEGGKKTSQTGSFIRNHDQFVLKTSTYQIMSYSKMSISVFEEDKIILLDDPKPADQMFMVAQGKMDQNITKVTELKTKESGIKQWCVFADQWQNKSLVKVDIIKNVPIEISIYSENADVFKDIPLVKIDFSNVVLEVNKSDLFNLSEFVQKAGDDYKPSKKYSSYQLINNLD